MLNIKNLGRVTANFLASVRIAATRGPMIWPTGPDA